MKVKTTIKKTVTYYLLKFGFYFYGSQGTIKKILLSFFNLNSVFMKRKSLIKEY